MSCFVLVQTYLANCNFFSVLISVFFSDGGLFLPLQTRREPPDTDSADGSQSVIQIEK